VAKRLGLTTTTLHAYVNGDGSPKAAGQALLDGLPRDAGSKPPRSSQGPGPRDAIRYRGAGRGDRDAQAALASLPARHPERKLLMASTAALYGVSRATLYPAAARRAAPQESAARRP
jgi:hypothetical protein